MCDIDEPETTQRSDKVLQIFIELPKFAGSLQEINESTPFLEKLSYVLMEMADCEDIPDNLNDPLLERLFKAADTAKMREDTKESYMRSILGEAEYEANLEDWKTEGLEEGRKQGLAKGLEEGREEGRKEGRKEGREEGREEGRKEGATASKHEVAGKMKDEGLSPELIAKCTGLSIAEAQAL